MVFVVVWLICAVIGALIGQPKGRAGAGFVLGLVLGLIGVAITIFLPAAAPSGPDTGQSAVVAGNTRRCPWCAEPIQMSARVCKHCGRDAAVDGWDGPPAGTPEGWLPDPSRRYPDRWWDGNEWTQWTRDRPGGTRYEDRPYTSTQ